MFEHPQYTYDRYTQEMDRIAKRLELRRVIEERREVATAQESQGEPRHRGWFRARRAARAEAARLEPLIPAGIGSASAIGR